MPGVYRAYTWVDILQSLNGTNQSTADTATSGVGYFAEADETVPCADSAIALAGVPLGWDQAGWSSVAWA